MGKEQGSRRYGVDPADRYGRKVAAMAYFRRSPHRGPGPALSAGSDTGLFEMIVTGFCDDDILCRAELA